MQHNRRQQHPRQADGLTGTGNNDRQTSPQYSRQDKQQQQTNKTRRAGHNDKPSPSFRDAQIAPSALAALKKIVRQFLLVIAYSNRRL